MTSSCSCRTEIDYPKLRMEEEEEEEERIIIIIIITISQTQNYWGKIRKTIEMISTFE